MLRRVLPLICQKSFTKRYTRDFVIKNFVLMPALFGGFYGGTWGLISVFKDYKLNTKKYSPIERTFYILSYCIVFTFMGAALGSAITVWLPVFAIAKITEPKYKD